MSNLESDEKERRKRINRARADALQQVLGDAGYFSEGYQKENLPGSLLDFLVDFLLMSAKLEGDFNQEKLLEVATHAWEIFHREPPHR